MPSFYQGSLGTNTGGKHSKRDLSAFSCVFLQFLADFTVEQARKAQKAGKPFFIHTTPVMPHWGTCIGPEPPAPGECAARSLLLAEKKSGRPSF